MRSSSWTTSRLGVFENLAAVHDHPQLTYVRGSIGNESLVHRVAAEVEQVYHLAAAVGVP